MNRSVFDSRGEFRCFFSQLAFNPPFLEIAYSRPPSLVPRHQRAFSSTATASHGTSFVAPTPHSPTMHFTLAQTKACHMLVHHASAVGCMYPRTHPGVLKPCTRLAYTRLCYRRSSTLFAVDDPLLCGECAGASYHSPACTAGGMVVDLTRPEAQPTIVLGLQSRLSNATHTRSHIDQ